MHVIVRDAVPEHADDIAHAHTEGWRQGYRGLVPARFLDSDAVATARRQGWNAFLAGSLAVGDRIRVAVVGGRAVGFGHTGLNRDDPSRGELLGCYVHPDHWGTGVAQAIIDRCHTDLSSLRSRAVLWVLRDNPRARAFYERNGWTCGSGDELVEAEWSGPLMAGVPDLDDPLPEVQYRRHFP